MTFFSFTYPSSPHYLRVCLVGLLARLQFVVMLAARGAVGAGRPRVVRVVGRCGGRQGAGVVLQVLLQLLIVHVGVVHEPHTDDPGEVHVQGAAGLAEVPAWGNVR